MKRAHVIILFLGFLLTPVLANRGSMTIPGTSVEETGQHAIVAWNGTEEVIILSTDMKSSKSAVVLEVIPLPSSPTVEKGSSQSFVILSRLLNDKKTRDAKTHYSGVEVMFHQKIGAHDVTVVNVTDVTSFTEWVTQFSREKAFTIDLPSDFIQTVSHYIDRSITYFVFDVVDLTESVQSIQPLVYQFESHYLYYPLEITATSAVGASSSDMNLFLIMDNPDIHKLRDRYPEIVFSEPVQFTKEELDQVSPPLGELFNRPAFVVNAFYTGPLHVLTNDIVYPELSEKEVESGKSLSAALSIDAEPKGHAKIVVVLWIVVVLLILVAVNRSH